MAYIMRTAVVSHSVRILTVAVLMALSGCAVFDADEQLDAMQSNSTPEYQQTFAEMETISWPQNDWWQRYGDPQLNQLMIQALERAPSLKIAQARLKHARGIAKQAGGQSRYKSTWPPVLLRVR